MSKPAILQFFKYDHLPPSMQMISKPFGDIAVDMVMLLPDNHERHRMLVKLLEAKDCAVRAYIFKEGV